MDYGKEEWRDVVGYEGLYQVSNVGRIRGLNRIDAKGRPIKGTVLKSAISANYRCVALTKNGEHKTHKVHSLVCEAFLGKKASKKIQCNHLNGDKLDNHIENLEYCTRSENGLHAFRVLGRSRAYALKGEKHKMAKLTDSDIIRIRDLYGNKTYSQKELAKIFNVRQTSISNIVLRKSWRHI